MENEVLEFLSQHVRMLHLRSCLVAADRACRISGRGSGVLDPLEFLRISIICVTKSMAEDLNFQYVLTGAMRKALLSTLHGSRAQYLIQFFLYILAKCSFFEGLWGQPKPRWNRPTPLALLEYKSLGTNIIVTSIFIILAADHDQNYDQTLTNAREASC